ncbi:24850_t:CDS:1 [Cetraspora pellucida]|uniref:Phosphatidylglycerol/phosphatidylinositol transfer protein n=1 Tax=Cetraspora pellucida TaxID=1433469 RepID=A0A9N9H5Y2_9GLOM|nr:24850_t:CDS:1 [Cetraspora pellucida]
MIGKLTLLFVFLAALSMVNAFPYHHFTKRAAKFGQCPPPFQPPPITAVISDVSISPDPPKAGSELKVTGSATTNVDITKDDFFGFVILDITSPATPVPVFAGKPVDICKKTTCPTKTFNFNEVYDLSSLKSLPATYIVGVAIGPITNDTSLVLACGEATFP